MKESTKEAFITVLNAMITHANRRIAGIKRRKSGGVRMFTMNNECKFKENCNILKERLQVGNGKFPLKFLREDQVDKGNMRANLEHILGKGHPEIDNIADFVFKD